MKSLVSTKTFSYILILLTLYISFLYFNGVFFIYKYKQLTNNAKPHSIISLIYFILPTLCYYMIILSLSSNFTVYPKKVFVILIFTTSFMLKVCSYYIDILIISQPKMVCFILCVQNVLIAVVDCFLHHLLDILFYSRKHRFSKFILLSVLIEEMPNYVFAVIFNMVELMYIKSFKPYFDIAAILYLLTGILICKTDLRKILCFELELMLKKQKLENINDKITQNNFAFNQNITLSTVYRYLSNILLAKKPAKTYKNIDLDSKQQMATKENTLYSNKYKLILYITKIINTSLDTFIYFYLMSEMREQSYLVMYFSINFLFKTVDVKLKPSMLVRFVSFKYFLTFLSLFSIFYLYVYRHYLFLLLCFMANGLLNQIIYRSFERCCERKEVVVAEIMIFGLVACLVLYYGQKPDESFEDFVFFSSVRL